MRRRVRELKTLVRAREKFADSIECAECHTKRWIVYAVAESFGEQDVCCRCRLGPDEPEQLELDAGEADAGFESRLEAERVTLEFGARSARRLDAGRFPIEDSPLFGGERQGALF